jgi:hypothetical protein
VSSMEVLVATGPSPSASRDGMVNSGTPRNIIFRLDMIAWYSTETLTTNTRSTEYHSIRCN